MPSRVCRVQLSRQSIDEKRPGEALGDPLRVVSKGVEQLAQHTGIPRAAGHPVHLVLDLFPADGSAPQRFESARFSQVVLDLGPQDSLRQDLLERRSRSRVLPGPAPVGPEDTLDAFLCGDSLAEAQLPTARPWRRREEAAERHRDAEQRIGAWGTPPDDSWMMHGPPRSLGAILRRAARKVNPFYLGGLGSPDAGPLLSMA